MKSDLSSWPLALSLASFASRFPELSKKGLYMCCLCGCTWRFVGIAVICVCVCCRCARHDFTEILPNTVNVCGLFLRLQNGPLVSFLSPVPQCSLSEFLVLSHQNAPKIGVLLPSQLPIRITWEPLKILISGPNPQRFGFKWNRVDPGSWWFSKGPQMTLMCDQDWKLWVKRQRPWCLLSWMIFLRLCLFLNKHSGDFVKQM